MPSLKNTTAFRRPRTLGQKLGRVLQRVERARGAIAALEIARVQPRVATGIGRLWLLSAVVVRLLGGRHQPLIVRVETLERSDRMRWPMNLSMAAWSSCLLPVNSCAALVRPLVWITAATSLAPM